MNIKAINQINNAIAEYFRKNPGIAKIPAKDLMPLFVAKGIFPKDERGGLPIRNLLRKLDKENTLNSIPYVIAERKTANTSWFFGRAKTVNVAPAKQIVKPQAGEKKTAVTSHSKSGFPPIINKDCRVLILGSLPGDESIRKGEYYAKSTNQFWRLMDAVLGNMPGVYAQKKEWLLKNKVAVWDVLAAAERKGSLDSNIRKSSPNDFARLYKQYPNVKYVFFNGGKAREDYRKYIGEDDNHSFHLLPSSSSAHAITWENKCKVWEVVKSSLKKNN